MEELDRHSNTENLETNVMDEEYAVLDNESCTNSAESTHGRPIALSEEGTAEQASAKGGADKSADAERIATNEVADAVDAKKADSKDKMRNIGKIADDDDADDDDADDDDADDDLPKVSRKVRRRRRRSRPRSKTIAMKRLTREELRKGALMYPPVDIPRPATRAECLVEQRPCPWVACKHHLYLDVNPTTGSIKINFPDLDPWDLPETCALDVAERGGITLEEVGDIMNLTRERIRQVEVRGLTKLRVASPSPEELGARLGEVE